MWLNRTIENDSPASGVCSERFHSYHCFLSFCHCRKQESKAYMRRPRGARNQRVTVRPNMAHISNLKAASACFQRKRGFSNSKSRAHKKERESWYIVFSGIEGPHTSMTVRTRLARTTAVREFSPVRIYRTGGSHRSRECHHVLQNSHLDGFQLVLINCRHYIQYYLF